MFEKSDVRERLGVIAIQTSFPLNTNAVLAWNWFLTHGFFDEIVSVMCLGANVGGEILLS